MLRIVSAPDHQQLHNAAVEHVCRMAKKGVARQILLVPEQFSFDTEWMLCQLGGDTISRYAEVLSFTRLANRVFAVTGGGAVPTLDQSGRLIAMAGALEQIRSRLKIYGSHVTKPEFLVKLLDMVDELKSYGVDQTALDRAKGHVTGALGQKLEELGLILETYEALCQGAKQDPASLPDRLCEALYACDYAEGRAVTVWGFTDFTAQELSVLEALLSGADSLTVFLPFDHPTGGQEVYRVPRHTAAQLRRAAARLQQDVVFAALPDPGGEGALAHLKRHLFSSSGAVFAQPTDEITLCRADSPSQEALYLVGRIQELVLSGCRYRDIAVACAEPAVYQPELENLFSRYGIQGYFSGRQALVTSPVIRGVLSALEAACCGMELGPVADYLAAGFSGISRDEADRLYNYAYVWDLSGRDWERPFTLHPDGFGQKLDEQASERLARLETLRCKAIGPLLALKQDILAAENTGAQIRALAAFLERQSFDTQLRALAERLQAEGKLQLAQTYSQLYDILISTVEQIYGVLSKSVRSAEDFFRFFRAALSQHHVSTIPASLDCVRVGSVPDLRHSRASHLFVLGANDGALPQLAAAGGLLTDAERKVLTELGLTLAPDRSTQVDRELLTAGMVLTGGQKSLYLSAQTGSESYLFTRIARMFPCCRIWQAPPLPVRPEQAAQAVCGMDELKKRRLFACLPELAQPEARLRELAAYQPGKLRAETVAGLYGRQIELTASKIDKYASCKYAYYLDYGLHAKERKQARIDAPLFGTFVHEVLEKLCRQVQSEGGFAEITEPRLTELTRTYIRAFVAQTLGESEDASPRTDYILRRSFDEVYAVVRELWQELRQSRFVPEGFELPFFDEHAITLAGQYAQCRITGVVDRVDLYTAPDGRTYLRVVDYKTGRKDFDYTDLLCGMGLQMLIYLFTLTDQSRAYFGRAALPAGVMYFPARYPVRAAKGRLSPEEAEKDRRSELRRKGLVLGDEEVIEAMEPGEEKKYLPVKYKKAKGEAPTLQGDVASPEQLRLLRRHVERSLGQMTDEIYQGELAPNPYYRGEEHWACKWCEYRTVCHVDSGSVPLRVLSATRRERFWQELEQEEERHGR